MLVIKIQQYSINIKYAFVYINKNNYWKKCYVKF